MAKGAISEQAIAEVRINDEQAADKLTDLREQALKLKENLEDCSDAMEKGKLKKELAAVEKNENSL